jgi:hypothetical protein
LQNEKEVDAYLYSLFSFFLEKGGRKEVRGQKGKRFLLSGKIFKEVFLKNYYFFWWDRGLNSGFYTCKSRHLSHASSPFALLFWRWDLQNYLPWLASDHNPLDLSLPSS